MLYSQYIYLYIYVPLTFPINISLYNAIFLNILAVGEPALCMAASCLFAVKDAIKAARKHNHDKPDNFCLSKTHVFCLMAK